MLHERPTAPLSPPTSPRMSDTPAKATQYHWQPLSSYVPTTPNVNHENANTDILQRPSDTTLNVDDQGRPPIRTYKSFPYSLGPSSRFPHDAVDSSSEQHNVPDYSDRLVTLGPQPTGSSDLQPATYGGSAPTSPAGRLTPQSGAIAASNEALDEEEEIEMDDAEGVDGEDKPPMTAAELRAAKRKMKRFRSAHPRLDRAPGHC